MIYLATLPDGETARQSDVAQATKVPLPFLSKLLASLGRSGLVKARRGPWGGIRLAKAAQSITVREVVEAVDGRSAFAPCILGFEGCDEKGPCALHEYWWPVRDRLERELYRRTLADSAPALVSGLSRRGL